jgi:drug/metabolite transporter (DMT)-like permease
MVLSLIALGFSGMLMIVLNSFSFQLQMHPVHKIFGIIMVIAGSLHLYLNVKPIKIYLQNRWVMLFAATMSALLLVLIIAGLNKPMDPELVEQVQQIMSQMEAK